MARLRRHTGFSDDRGRGQDWQRSNRAQRRDHKLDRAQEISALRWGWRVACERSRLSRMIYTPSGVSVAIPIIDHIDLGPPVTLRIRMRAGQTLADFEQEAPSLAAAMNVAALHVTTMTPPWVLITVRLV